MILTPEDLNAIGLLIDQKVEPKFEEVNRKFDVVNKKIDLIVEHLNLTEVFENSKGVSLGLAKKIHEANK